MHATLLQFTNAYRACVPRLDFWFQELKTGVAKESSAAGYKYAYRQIYAQTGFLRQSGIISIL